MSTALTEHPDDAAGPAFTAQDFEAHHGQLYRYVRKRVSRVQDLEDLVQEVYLRMLRVRKSEALNNPLAYIYGIASHVVSEFYMRQGNARVEFDSDGADARAQSLSESQSGESGPVLMLQVTEALGQLSPNHQAVLLLIKRDGYSIQETAEKLGLSEHTVKKYCVEALVRVRASLNE